MPASRRSDGSEHDHQTQYLAWDWIGNFNLFSQRHDLLIGADTERVDNFRGDTWRGPAVGGFNIYNPVYGNLATPSLLNPAQSDRSDELHSRSIYAKDNWHLNDQWILVLGGRYQRLEQLVEHGRGATYVRPTDQVAFYGNYSRSFVPNASDATTGQAFDPEEGRSYELGVKLDLPQGIGASLALFDIEKENVVVSNNNVSEAAGKVGSRGVELASASAGNCSAATPTPIRKSSMTRPTKVTSWSTPHATSPVSTSPITWICHSNSVSGDWGAAHATSASAPATTPTHSGWTATRWPMPSSVGTVNCSAIRLACN